MHWSWTSRIIGAGIDIVIAAMMSSTIHRGNERKRLAKDTEENRDERKGRIDIPAEVTLESLVMRYRTPNQTLVQTENCLSLILINGLVIRKNR